MQKSEIKALLHLLRRQALTEGIDKLGSHQLDAPRPVLCRHHVRKRTLGLPHSCRNSARHPKSKKRSASTLAHLRCEAIRLDELQRPAVDFLDLRINLVDQRRRRQMGALPGAAPAVILAA